MTKNIQEADKLTLKQIKPIYFDFNKLNKDNFLKVIMDLRVKKKDENGGFLLLRPYPDGKRYIMNEKDSKKIDSTWGEHWYIDNKHNNTNVKLDDKNNNLYDIPFIKKNQKISVSLQKISKISKFVNKNNVGNVSLTKINKKKNDDQQNVNMYKNFGCVIYNESIHDNVQIKKFWTKKIFIEEMSKNIYKNIDINYQQYIWLQQVIDKDTFGYGYIDLHNEKEVIMDPTNYIFNIEQISQCGYYNILKHEERIPGITNSFMYIGTKCSIFQLHREDINLYAVNQVLWGYPKSWYCIAEQYTKKVYKCLDVLIDNEDGCNNSIQHKNIYVDANYLLKMNIPVYYIESCPGDLVITPPGGLHQGYNQGCNISIAINFLGLYTEPLKKEFELYYKAFTDIIHNKCKYCNKDESLVFIDIEILFDRLRESQKKIEIESKTNEKKENKKESPPLLVLPPSNVIPSSLTQNPIGDLREKRNQLKKIQRKKQQNQ